MGQACLQNGEHDKARTHFFQAAKFIGMFSVILIAFFDATTYNLKGISFLSWHLLALFGCISGKGEDLLSRLLPEEITEKPQMIISYFITVWLFFMTFIRFNHCSS